MKFRPWLEGAGLAMLYLLTLIAGFLASGQRSMYHQVMPITSLTRGTLIDLLLIALVLGAGFTWLRAMKSTLLRRLLWLGVIFVTAFVSERGLATFLRSLSVQFPSWIEHLPWIVSAVAVLLLVIARRYYDLLVRAAEVFLMSAGIATLFVILPQLVYACFNHAPPEQASFSHPVSQPWRSGEPRVVWLLYDELSYNQVFGHPQPQIQLPAFNRLKQESISFSDLVPDGDFTEMVIPSLFLGQPIGDIKSNRRAELLWRENQDSGWKQFDQDATVFAAARRQNWGTGAVGWYNPYCRILANVLDYCYWTSQDFAGGSRFGRLSSERTALENAWNALPLMQQVKDAMQHTGPNLSHKSDYQRVFKAAKSLIADNNIRFAFIHLPIPHPPGIYRDPQGGREDYLGNLILADKSLSELRTEIKKSASAEDTILIVSSDHSWRVGMWRGSPGWTAAEEQATNHGQFDDRPVLLVHFPGRKDAESIDKPVSVMIVHSLLLDIFSGKISKPEDLYNLAQAEPAVAGS